MTSTSAKYASINKRKTLAKLAALNAPLHRAHAINATSRPDRQALWSVVCADCAHEWRKTNAYDHGSFGFGESGYAEALAFTIAHNKIFRYQP